MYQHFLSFLFILTLAACGGGSSLGDTSTVDDGSGTVSDSETVTISLTLLDQQNASSVNVDTDNPLTAQANVLVDGQAKSNIKVTFSLVDDIGELRVTSALSDAEGNASVVLYAGSVTGAGTITAAVEAVTYSVNYSATVITDGGEVGGEVNPLDIALLNAQGITTLNVSSSSPVTVEASLVIDGQPQVGEKVTFRLIDQVGELRITTALTNTNGIASVILYAGDNEGAGTVAATVGDYYQESNFSVSISAVDVTMSEISTTPDTIGPNGTASLSVIIEESVDGVATPLSGSVSVEFTSACAQLGLAIIDTDVSTINGIATATYQDQGCGQVDTITVTTTVGQTAFFETTQLTVLGAEAGSIEFVSASPTFIALKGTGGISRSETSSLTFVVKDVIGNVVSDALVNFNLNTNVGGITMSPEPDDTQTSQAKTNSNGEVTLIVTAGTVPTSVIVTATLDGTSIATISNSLAISTGVLDANSLSLSFDNQSPEALDYDGTEVNVTARLADHFNNPVPDGTIVNFSTEFGAIQASCSTVGGNCDVVWTSQSPKAPDPAFRDPNAITRTLGQSICYNGNTITSLSYIAMPCPGNFGAVHGNRVTIFAHAIGEESFNDANANGRFDAGEAYTDLTEAFQDDNNDGLFTALLGDGTPVAGAASSLAPGYQHGGDNEEFVDFDSDQEFDGANGLYNGVLCNDAEDGCLKELVTVSRNGVISQAGSDAFISLIEKSDNMNADIFDITKYGNTVQLFEVIADDPATTDVDESARLELSSEVWAFISDIHNGPMPSGTTVSFTSTNGTIVGDTQFTLSNQFSASQVSVAIEADDEPSTGSLIVTVTTPFGVTSKASIAITD